MCAKFLFVVYVVWLALTRGTTARRQKAQSASSQFKMKPVWRRHRSCANLCSITWPKSKRKSPDARRCAKPRMLLRFLDCSRLWANQPSLPRALRAPPALLLWLPLPTECSEISLLQLPPLNLLEALTRMVFSISWAQNSALNPMRILPSAALCAAAAPPTAPGLQTACLAGSKRRTPPKMSLPRGP